MVVISLDLNRAEDLKKFLDSINKFGFLVYHDEKARLILLRGDVTYFGYFDYGRFAVTIWHDGKKFDFMRDTDYNLVTLISHDYDVQFIIPKGVTVEYQKPCLLIKY